MNNILNTANDIINGDRKDEYGDAFDSFDRIAGLWSSYLDYHITPVDVAQMMILMKVSRGANVAKFNAIQEDSLVDIVGYSALAYQVSENYSKDEAARNVKDDGFEMACKCHPSNTDADDVEEDYDKDPWEDVTIADVVIFLAALLSDDEEKEDEKENKKSASFQDILNDVLGGLSEDE